MRRLLCTVLATASLLGAASSAHAFANHKIEAVQKIVTNGHVVGARVHLVVDPQNYQKFRINVAPQADVPATNKATNIAHRQTLAGAFPGFVIKTLAEQLNASGLTEMYVDIPYGGPLKAGQKVNLLSTFTNDSKGFTRTTSGHIHVYGAWDGPLTQHDAAYIIELPGATSSVPVATTTLAPSK